MAAAAATASASAAAASVASAKDLHRLYARFRDDVALRQRATDGPAAATNEVPAAQQPLRVQLCELYARDNASQHHTERFGTALHEPYTPVLRRGQPFLLALRFDRPFDVRQDNLQFVFEFESNRGASKGLTRTLRIPERKQLRPDAKAWDAIVHKTETRDPNTTVFQVMIAASAKVGVWGLVVQSERKDVKGGVRSEYRSPDLIYILFNPWSKEDVVYMENDTWRNEYVLNEHGKVWTGTAQSVVGKPWVFGQFEAAVLPCVVMLLHGSRLSAVDRGNPVLVCRAIAQAVNGRHNGGLITQTWGEDFHNGTNPGAWTGSVSIMEQFLETGRSVNYGLAWVFSALTVTACRALGIPCRSVTGYNAAQERDNAQVIEVRVSRGGERDWTDNVWNFHTWNEVWIARPELPDGYGGWQAVDATVRDGGQESLHCGLVPVEALHRGHVGVGHHAHSLFSALNADVLWFVDDGSPPDKNIYPHVVDTRFVGKRIVTKKIGRDDDQGSSDLEDITAAYKYAEGSPAERQAMMNAARSSEYSTPSALVRDPQDVEFELVEIDGAFFGQDFNITLHVHNASAGHRRITYTILAKSADYRGHMTAQLKREGRVMKLLPKQRETVKLPVTVSDYLGKIKEEGHINVFAMAVVDETLQFWLREHKVSLKKPRIGIQLKGTAKVGWEATAVFSFQNPLALPLTECGYSVDAPGLLRPKILPFRDVKPGELVTFEERVLPRLAGDRKIAATFYSRELPGVTGRLTINVLTS